LNIRKLTDKDWDTLVSWWDNWPKWQAPVKDFLPENGKGGLIVEINNIPVVAGFIYLTNSKTALLEWIVSNPKYREADRKDAIELLITGSENLVKSLDYKYLFAVMQHKGLIKIHEKLGWKADAKHSYELTKIL
jgi:hypothetical protein|tara:strand:+ start:1301 stop:1702 length:402 start_codon:yes stop_codon:yes gene_type:complete